MKITLEPYEIVKLLNEYREYQGIVEAQLNDRIKALERKILAQEIIINMQKDKKLLTDEIIKNMEKGHDGT